MKKYLKIIIPIFIIVIIAIVVIKRIKQTKSKIANTPAPASQVLKVKGVKIKKGTIQEIYPFLAKIYPDKIEIISSKISGRIKKLYVNEGDTVKKGDLIAEIDNIPIKLEIKSLNNEKNSISYQIKALKSDILSAKADLDFKKANFLRDRALFKGKAISKEQFQQTETLYKIAKNKVISLNETINSLNEKIKSLDKKIKLLKHDLTYTRIYNEINGKVSRKYLEKGSFLAAGKPIIEIEKDSNYKILFDIPSKIANKINKSSFIIAKINDRKEKLPISKIYPNSATNSLVTVEARIKKLPANIPSGSFINIELVTNKKHGIIVPANAILSLTDGDYVLTEKDNKIKKIKIKKIVCDENNCIVKGDIKQNQIIATGMEDKLRLLLFKQNGEIVTDKVTDWLIGNVELNLRLINS